MVEDVLRGLLCCERNDTVKEFLFLVVVHVKEREEEEKLWRSGLGLIGWRRAVFIGIVILWIALGFGARCCWLRCRQALEAFCRQSQS